MERFKRKAPLPDEMQGRWINRGKPPSELIIEGGEITCYGAKVEYDYKTARRVDGNLIVDLDVYDDASVDEFRRRNIIGLVITAEGEFLVWNVKFGDQFYRPPNDD